MSNLLYRLGRSAATRPWVAIGAWVVLALVVVASSVAFGRELEESFEAPGLDSYRAAELLAEAQADEGGITAHVVLEALRTLRRSWHRWSPLLGSSRTC